MKHILVVDDEQRIRELIKKYAVFEDFKVTECCDGVQAVTMCQKETFDLIIMDIMMPNLDGFSAYRIIKKMKDIPVIMLTARGEEYDRIHGFELGADDYVVKPFYPKELMMRIHAVLKRHSEERQNNDKDYYNIEGLSIDYNGRIVSVDGQRIDLTPKEYELLFFLTRNRGIALSREKLLNNIWGYDFYGDDRTLDTHIKLLRKSLGEYSKFIVTVRGVGYRFEETPIS